MKEITDDPFPLEIKIKNKHPAMMPFVIVRTFSAGVHYGYLAKRVGKEVQLFGARRIWQWQGAFTLSELAQNGTTKPKDCKFSCEIDEIILTESIEIIPISDKSKKTLDAVVPWKI